VIAGGGKKETTSHPCAKKRREWQRALSPSTGGGRGPISLPNSRCSGGKRRKKKEENFH